MPRFPFSALILAAALAVALLFGTGCGRSGGSVAGGPVVVIAIDGVAWEVIAPLLAGERYPMVDWSEPVDLLAGGEWREFDDETMEPVAPPRDGPLLMRDTSRRRPAGLSTSLDLDFPRRDRYRIEGRALAGRAPARLTLGVRYAFPGGEPPPLMPGNNETVCKSFDLGTGSGELRLDLQPPTTASAMEILLLRGEVDCVARRFDRARQGGGPSVPIEVAELKLLPGKLRGLPPEGFDWAALPGAEDRLPNLTRLIRNGVSGYLRNIDPTLSPVIWTSVATGEGPQEHGIEDFLMPAPGAESKMHVSSSMRRTPALWNIVTDYGQKSVGVVSWWATWPAETVRGFVVSDHANEAAVRLKEDRGYLPKEAGLRAVYAEYDTYPRDLAARLREAQDVAPGLRRQDLQRLLVGLDEPTWQRFRDIAAVDRRRPESLLKFHLLKDLTTFKLGLSLFEEISPDLWMIYFNGQDSMQHLFWHFVDPDIYPRVERSELPLYGQIVENYYKLIDGFIGRIADAAGPGANLLVLSDHGVHGMDFMQSNTKSGGHSWRSQGILVASGSAFKRGLYTRTASIFDIAPTVLSLLDYPVATGLKGAPLRRLLRPEWLRQHPIRTIDRYEFLSPRRGGEVPEDDQFDAEVTTRLRALGYLD